MQSVFKQRKYIRRLMKLKPTVEYFSFDENVDLSYDADVNFLHIYVSRLVVVSCETKEKAASHSLTDLILTHVSILQEQMP